MNILIHFAFALLLVSSVARATVLTAHDLRSRFELRTDIYTLDKTGKKVISGPNDLSISRMNADSGVIETSNGSKFDGNKIFLHSRWSILEDGSIKAVIEEYAEQNDRKFSGLLQKKELVLENFEPILWNSLQKNQDKVLVRFIPTLREVAVATSAEGMPIAGKNIVITDSNGFRWADELRFSGKYAGISTHRGTLVLSYQPFRGAKLLGTAEGKEIRLTPAKGFIVKMSSSTDFLPAELTANVYGLYDPNKKSKGVNSVHSWDSDSESKILEGYND